MLIRKTQAPCRTLDYHSAKKWAQRRPHGIDAEYHSYVIPALAQRDQIGYYHVDNHVDAPTAETLNDAPSNESGATAGTATDSATEREDGDDEQG